MVSSAVLILRALPAEARVAKVGEKAAAEPARKAQAKANFMVIVCVVVVVGVLCV